MRLNLPGFWRPCGFFEDWRPRASAGGRGSAFSSGSRPSPRPGGPMSTASRPTPGPVPALVARIRARFDEGHTRSAAWRVRQLEGLARMCREREAEIEAALRTDLGKCHLEAFSTEINYSAAEAELAAKKVRGWMKPDRVSTTLVAQPGTSRIYKDPLGVVLIIAPWNYPFQLAVAPLIGALAAGNCAVVKPSEVAPATSAVLAEWLPQYVDPEAVVVVEGGVPETTALLEQRFDHIFYTGNGHVGRIVMAAAAKHLTPVTLELGGKSPTVVDTSADLAVAAKRIAWGKFTNAGQTCVAPDYVLVERAVHDAFVAELVAAVKAFYGADPQASGDFGRIINPRHFDRLKPLLDSGTVAVGGQHDRDDRFIAPTVLTDVAPESPVMADEIFGPILPVIAVDSVDAAIAFINARPKPLALYMFSSDKAKQEAVLARTSSGGAVINHCVMHLAVHGLPFGGVGESGMGGYHGKHSFDVFTHHKSVLKKPTAIDPAIMYPPYDDAKVKWLKRLL
ncbi:MAG: aldehyde dehydrogenase family protein [Myxococcales bacterium]|nr:aldehyde dehydrogenase family protein [Myxococcales bacterium]MCB9524686.1 aldehyde dehydrogenase family protein [Myxococcales bacterium]